jgi:peptidoglycan/LPS O-acetylase OafA/YrhL
MNKRNNFDFLRLAFASMVMLYHCAALSKDLRIEWMSRVFNPALAVQGFFVISGFLIFMSYTNSSNLREYFEKRVRRLYPAYVFTIFLFAGFLSVFSAFDVWQYFRSAAFTRYIFNNMLFLNYRQPCLPGVFEGNSLCAVNGALWTIKVEVMFYLMVPLIFIAVARYHKAVIFIFLYIASALYHLYFTHVYINAELARQLPGQLMFFIGGGALYSYFDRFDRFRYALLVPSLVLFVANHWAFSQVLYYFYPLALSVLVVYMACSLRYFGNFGRIGDLSYGIYIYHFPIIQILVYLGLFVQNPVCSVIAVTAITALLSFFSWHVIEKRFLKRSSHYVQATLPDKRTTKA